MSTIYISLTTNLHPTFSQHDISQLGPGNVDFLPNHSVNTELMNEFKDRCSPFPDARSPHEFTCSTDTLARPGTKPNQGLT